jgi:hypothetical protein
MDTTALKPELAKLANAHWPELCARLGDRLADFVDASWRTAATHQLLLPEAIARYVILCFALGPSFEQKPENEWALAILSDERLGEWVKVHQLVVQGSIQLKRRMPDNRSASGQLQRADTALMDFLDADNSAISSEAVSLSRLSCDIDVIELRLLETDWRQEYAFQSGEWLRQARAAPSKFLRVASGQAMPPIFCVLTHAANHTNLARLQVRMLTHSVCDQDRHPLVAFAGEHGLWSWRGHAARTNSWKIHCGEAPKVSNGLGTRLIAETLPHTSLLRTTTCGLRDEGVPTGSLETYVWAYSAHQFLLEWSRKPDQASSWPVDAVVASKNQPASSMSCRFERDGANQPHAKWLKQFQTSLDDAITQGLGKLFSNWQGSFAEGAMTASANVLCGKASLSWGWREDNDQLATQPVMRVAAEVDLVNAFDLTLSGLITQGTTQTRVRLMAAGGASLVHHLIREQREPSLVDSLLAMTATWQVNFELEFDPVATHEASLWTTAGPCTGALTGQAGLRPSAGEGGWEWFAQMENEAVSASVCVHDPVLGQNKKTLTLLPPQTLLNWSHG